MIESSKDTEPNDVSTADKDESKNNDKNVE